MWSRAAFSGLYAQADAPNLTRLGRFVSRLIVFIPAAAATRCWGEMKTLRHSGPMAHELSNDFRIYA